MNMDLSGKNAIVTGSAAGIGWGCAKSLASCGAAVTLVARQEDALKTAKAGIEAAVSGAEVHTCAVDLSTGSGCQGLIKQAPTCDILVNNLGVYYPKSFFEATDNDWQQQFDTNLMPGVRLSRHYVPKMIQGGWGRVVFVSSVDALLINTDSLQYGVTKAGVLALSRGIAKLAAYSGVTVNAVLPGPTQVEWLTTFIQQTADKTGKTFAETAHQGVMARYPSSLRGEPLKVEEVANLVVYLCSHLSSATTGSALRADGGIVDKIS